MARLWDNRHYEHPELKAIRLTLKDAMIGSSAKDAADMRNLLNAERTVEQTMRNRTAQELAGNPMWGDRWATLLGVPPTARPSASPADEGFIENRQRQEFAKALGGSAAWREDPHHLASAGKAVGETELQHALLGSQAGAADALAGRRQRGGAYDQARTNVINTQAKRLKELLVGEVPEAVQQAAAGLNPYQIAQAVNETAEGAGETDAGFGPVAAPVEIDVPWDETAFNDFTVNHDLYKSLIPLVESGKSEDIAKAVESLRRFFSPEKIRYILQQIKTELGGG